MIVTLLRPSPQVPKPCLRSAIMCYEAASTNIKSLSKQMETSMVDITWIFVLTLFQAVNTILWSISYPEVRALHGKEELEENIDIALDIILKCRERWPGTGAAYQLYSKLAKACLRSYDTNDSLHAPSSLSATSPASLTDANSPSASEHSSATTSSLAYSQNQFQTSSPPQFGYVFDQMPEPISNLDYGHTFPPRQPSFRSGSIFASPSSMQTDRRFSYFPPEFTQPHGLPNAWNPIATSQQQQMPAPPLPQMQQAAIADPAYLMQATHYNFGSHYFGDQNIDTEMRHGSLSQQQQIELMESLETEGLAEIDQFMQGYDNSIKP